MTQPGFAVMKAALVVVAIACGGVAAADAGAALDLEVAGDCPSAAAVMAKLSAALPAVRSAVRGVGLHVTVRDDGAGYSITSREGERRFPEPAHHCGARADAVALVIALQLAPPAVSMPRAPTRVPRSPIY